jgi:hypothetical protein
MNWKVTASVTLAGFILCASAHATVVTSYFCFGPGGCNANGTPVTNGTPTQVSNGVSFNGTAGGTISVFADQANSSGTFVTPAKYYSTPTESGLFEVSDKYYNRGVGIAPYNPVEGTSSGTYSNQDGLTDTVYKASNNNNFLLLELGNDITAGTTVSFLLQAGVSGDTFDIYTGSSTMPTSFSGMTKANSSPINIDEGGTSQPNGTSPNQPFQYSITKTGSGVEWVAISADCHYLLLDQIQTTYSYSSVPEPRFYGLLMAGLLGIAAVYARKRRATLPQA